jgi:hypothetical protein
MTTRGFPAELHRKLKEFSLGTEDEFRTAHFLVVFHVGFRHTELLLPLIGSAKRKVSA